MDGESEVRLSLREHQRLEILKSVQEGRTTQIAAARTLELSDRWVRVLLKRLARKGPQALVHGNRGRPSNHRTKDTMRQKILTLYRERYDGFNLTHLREMLIRSEKITKPPSRESLRTMLLSAGLWSRRREAPKHRLRRPRREHEGELLQVDASIHRWLGDDQMPIALVGGIDDATGDVPHAQFFPAETTEAYFIVLRETLRKRGRPLALYSDQDSVFVITNKHEREALAAQGRVPLTQFGRALKELGIEWIRAYSPQAKGRIERLWGTFQDRLLNEMRLKGIKTIEDANRYLAREFLPHYNRRFKRPAAKPDSVYRQAPLARDLEGVLCWKETRILARDHTFSFENTPWQVLPCDRVPALSGRRVEIRRTLRGQIQAWYGSVRLSIRPAPAFPKPSFSLDRRVVRAAVPADYPVRGRVRF